MSAVRRRFGDPAAIRPGPQVRLPLPEGGREERRARRGALRAALGSGLAVASRPDEFDRAFAPMAAVGARQRPDRPAVGGRRAEPGRYDEAHLAGARRHPRRRADATACCSTPRFLIGGEVGDAVLGRAVARRCVTPTATRACVRLQAEHVAMLARRWEDDPAILAWDLTDEPPLWLFKDTTDDEARAWTRALTAAIRGADATAPGHDRHGGPGDRPRSVPRRRGGRPAGLRLRAPVPDLLSRSSTPTRLLAPRMTHAAAFETALAAGAGRPVMVHEYGASSAQFDAEAIADYDRLLAWSSFGRGAARLLPLVLDRRGAGGLRAAPYVRSRTRPSSA